MYVLGIDGGGTKTKGVIASSTGEIIAEATVGASNPNSVKEPDLRVELAKLIDSLKSQSGNIFPDVKRVFTGMSGVDHPDARKRMHKLLASLLPASINVTVNNDAITALYSGTFGEPGIVQIGGTGSITYGLNSDGVFDRVGGWGYLIGEKGSGFALGRDGLEAAFSAHDGLGDETDLQRLILEHFQEKSLPDIIQTVYRDQNKKELIASLGRIVIEAADDGDRVAENIIKENALHMGESIACLIKKLFTDEGKIPIVVTGGLFNRLDLFQGSIEEVLNRNGIDGRLVIPKMDPVGGAVVAALREEGVVIRESFIEKFLNQ